MATKTKRPDIRPDQPEICLQHENNLLEFLNFIDLPEQLACAIGRDGDDAVLRMATKILKARAKIGAFRKLDDVAPVMPLKSEIAVQLLHAARYSLAPVQRLETVSLLPVFVSPPFALAYPGRILFDIEWTSVPPEWVKYIVLLIELSSKRLGLSQRLKTIEDRMAALRKRLKEVLETGTLDSVQAVYDSLKRAMQEEAEIEREVGDINKLIQRKDLRGLAKLVTDNIEDQLRDLWKRRAAALAEKPADIKEVERLLDEIADKKDSIKKIREEIKEEIKKFKN